MLSQTLDEKTMQSIRSYASLNSKTMAEGCAMAKRLMKRRTGVEFDSKPETRPCETHRLGWHVTEGTGSRSTKHGGGNGEQGEGEDGRESKLLP